MGFPSEKLEGVYRNPLDEVLRLLESRHRDHYKIYNLCSERRYDPSKFHNRVAIYPIDDHHPPDLEMIRRFCEDLDEWLAQDRRNVAAIHCKAGKGRTGVMICAYLLHRGLKSSAEEALDFYGCQRTKNSKGVTIPSQRRYVHYYGLMLSHNLKYETQCVQLLSISFAVMPNISGAICFSISQSKTKFWNSPVYELRRNSGSSGEQQRAEQVQQVSSSTATTPQRFDLNPPLALSGDIKVQCYQVRHLFNNPKITSKKEAIFHFCFNTFFINHHVTPSDPTHGDELPSALDDEAWMSQYLTNDHNLSSSSRSSVSSDRSANSGDDSLLAEEKEKNRLIIATFRKGDVDPANKDKSSKLLPPDFLMQLLFRKEEVLRINGNGIAAPCAAVLEDSDHEPEVNGTYDTFSESDDEELTS